MHRIIGSKYFLRVAKRNDLVGNFNSQLAGAILVNCEEATFGGNTADNDTLKDLITSDTILVNPKFVPQFTMRSYSRFLFTTNGSYSHNTSEDERRYLFLDVPDTFSRDPKYFNPLWGEINGSGIFAFADFLYQLKRPDGVDLRNPPRTAAHGRLLAESLSVEERFFYNALITGEGYPPDAADDGGEVFLSDVKEAFSLYLDNLGKRNSLKLSDNRFVPGAAAKFWCAEPEGRRTRKGVKETVYSIPSLKDARAIAVENGLLPASYAMDDDDDE